MLGSELIFPLVGIRWAIRRGTFSRMPDEWNERLQCPLCGKIGVASLSQNNRDDTLTVHSVSDGFKVVQTQYGPDFHWETCDVPMRP
jgi:hypothetical protein